MGKLLCGAVDKWECTSQTRTRHLLLTGGLSAQLAHPTDGTQRDLQVLKNKWNRTSSCSNFFFLTLNIFGRVAMDDKSHIYFSHSSDTTGICDISTAHNQTSAKCGSKIRQISAKAKSRLDPPTAPSLRGKWTWHVLTSAKISSVEEMRLNIEGHHTVTTFCH